MDHPLRERATSEQAHPGVSHLWTQEDHDRAWRIRQWEAAGAPVAEGAPDPLDRCYGARNAQPEQLVGEELTVEELAPILSMTTRAVTSLASKSYRLIESDLWNDLVGMVLGDLKDEKAALADEIEGAKTTAASQPMRPQAAAVVAALKAQYECISSTLIEKSAAGSAGKGWVEPDPKAREGPLSFLWQHVLLRRFPTHGNNLQQSRDCEILRDPENQNLAFAIVKPGGRGRGNAWLFRRAKVPELVQEWRRPPSYVMGPRDLPRLTR